MHASAGPRHREARYSCAGSTRRNACRGARVKDRHDQPLFITAIGLSAFALFALELLAGRLALPVI